MNWYAKMWNDKNWYYPIMRTIFLCSDFIVEKIFKC